jgi:hypothetical protein
MLAGTVTVTEIGADTFASPGYYILSLIAGKTAVTQLEPSKLTDVGSVYAAAVSAVFTVGATMTGALQMETTYAGLLSAADNLRFGFDGLALIQLS